MKQTKDSSYLGDPKKFDFKKAMDSTAPGAVKQKDVPDGTPNAGTRAAALKSTEPGPFKYRFGTNTVMDASEIPNAKRKAQDIQEGQNKSKLNPDTPPGGSSLTEPGDNEKFETGLIGTP